MISLPGVKTLKEKEFKLIQDKHNILYKQPRFSYNWTRSVGNEKDLEEVISRGEMQSLPFVGYGSLLNTKSASLTLTPEVLKSRIPVIAFGARRIFNYSMGEAVTRYGVPENEIESAALNVRLTGSIHDTLNAVLINIPIEEIPKLRDREIGYDLEPIVCVRWNGNDNEPFIAYILQCPDNPRTGKVRTNNTLMPHRIYIQKCRDGAEEFGTQFLEFWLSSTYLANGITTIKEWES